MPNLLLVDPDVAVEDVVVAFPVIMLGLEERQKGKQVSFFNFFFFFTLRYPRCKVSMLYIIESGWLSLACISFLGMRGGVF